jgi:hypothetical protein
MPLLLRHFKDVFCKMAGAEVYGSVEDVPFVPSLTRYLFSILDLRAVRNSLPTLPTSRFLFVGRIQLTAVD